MEIENWKPGKFASTVVSDSTEGFINATGHCGEEAIEYYGGTLICESIYRPKDVKLISAAPDMLAALLEYKRLYESVQPTGGWQGVYEEGNYAIKKATE